MESTDAEQLYTQKASLYHRVFFDILSYQKGILKYFKKRGILKNHQKILDAGCGSGAVTKSLYQLAKDQKFSNISFQAFDITQAMLDLFQQWINKEQISTISLKKADVLTIHQSLPEEWRNYDLIVSSAMLEYIPKNQIHQALNNLHKRLKPGGKMILIITKKNRLMKLLIKKWWKANMYEHQEITAILKEVGFKNIICKTFPFPYWHLNHWGFVIEMEKE